MLPLFAIACLRKVHVLLRPRVDKGAKVLDGVRLHSSGSTWCGCSRVVFVLPRCLLLIGFLCFCAFPLGIEAWTVRPICQMVKSTRPGFLL